MKKLYLLFIACLCIVLISDAQTTVFSYTGSMQTYVVPACTDSIIVDVKGAQGGGITTVIGGLGGRVQATIPVTAGQTLYIYVGGQGTATGGAGYNGGGTGIGGSLGGGGGGASDIRSGGTTLNDRIVVGGGGGGSCDNGGNALGGAGGGLTGGTGGVGGDPWTCNITAATGGTQVAGGTGGTSTGCSWNGFNGTFGIGGNSYNNYRSAGGGGGWYGGGGAHNGAAGAGGSSYTIATASGVVHTQGFQTGNGEISITPVAGGITLDLGADTTVCGSITLDAGTATSWSWSTGDSLQTLLVNMTGAYYVDITDTNGCPGTDTIYIMVNSLPQPDLGGDSASCDPITLDAGPANSWAWSTGDSTQTITVSMSGSYSVTVMDSNGCSNTDSVTYTLNPAPTVSITGLDSFYCSDVDSVALTGQPSGGTFSGTGVSGNLFSPSTAGVGQYSIVYDYTDSLGCSGSDTMVVTVDVCQGLANGIGAFDIYPNPNNGSFTVRGLPLEAEYNVISITGQIIAAGRIADPVLKMELGNVTAGMYYFTCRFEGQSVVRKIVVR